MNNLQKTKAAWPLGFSASFLKICRANRNLDTTFQVANALTDPKFQDRHHHYSHGVYLTDETGSIGWFGSEEVNRSNWLITGYIYAGQLAGNEIPEGQKFRVKKTGNIIKYDGKNSFNTIAMFKDEYHVRAFSHDKSEVEPVFE